MNTSRQTLNPMQLSGYSGSLGAEPALLNGMQVLFDQQVAVYPVVLEREDQEPDSENANGSRASGYGRSQARPGVRRSAP